MYKFLGQIIKRAYLSLSGKDKGNFSHGQVSYNNKIGECELIYPYGFSANAPVGSLVLMFNVMGQEENRAGIVNYPQKRFKHLKEWEVQVGNYKTKASIKFDEHGHIIIHTPDSEGKVYVEAPNNHVIVKSGKTIRLEADRIEIAATQSIKWDVGGRGYTYYPSHTDTWEECTVPGSSNSCQPPEHNDGIPNAT